MGGVKAKSNLVDACYECNFFKRSKTLHEFIRAVSKILKKGQGIVHLDIDQTTKVVKNAEYLINTGKIHQHMFNSKYDYEHYLDRDKTFR
jgi:hypothetical protein